MSSSLTVINNNLPEYQKASVTVTKADGSSNNTHISGGESRTFDLADGDTLGATVMPREAGTPVENPTPAPAEKVAEPAPAAAPAADGSTVDGANSAPAAVDAPQADTAAPAVDPAAPAV